MTEIWLRTNRRVPLVLLLAGLSDVVMGGLLAVLFTGVAFRGAGAGLAAVGFVVAIWGLVKLRRPRLAYRSGQVLFYVHGRRPVEVPVAAVEGFLLGQGPSYLPGEAPARLETATIVVRLSQRYPEWEQAETNSAVASWCGHYVTLRGTWCEPLTLDVVNRLNARLAEVAPSWSQRVMS